MKKRLTTSDGPRSSCSRTLDQKGAEAHLAAGLGRMPGWVAMAWGRRRFLSAVFVVLAGVRVTGAAAGPTDAAEPPAATAAMAFPPRQTVDLTLPFEGTWGVVQGFDSGNTHIGYAAYALDFVPTERMNPATPRKRRRALTDFPCYGRPVLAPADGKIVWARDGARDERPWVKAKYDAGNFVIIEHGPAQYTELRHLKRGSVRVVVGEQVRRGQAVGSCGNSGTATTPHLHVGLLGSVAPIATRPMRFSHYEVLAPDGGWTLGDGIPRKGEMMRSLP